MGMSVNDHTRVAQLVECLADDSVSLAAIRKATAWNTRTLEKVKHNQRATATEDAGFIIHESGRYRLAKDDASVGVWRASEVTFIWRRLRVLEHAFALYGGKVPAEVEIARQAMEDLHVRLRNGT